MYASWEYLDKKLGWNSTKSGVRFDDHDNLPIILNAGIYVYDTATGTIEHSDAAYSDKRR